MIINIPAPVDATKAVTLDIRIRDMPISEECRRHVHHIIDAFETLGVEGGLVYKLDLGHFPKQTLHGTLSWHNSGIIYSSTHFPYGDCGLALLLRMFRRAAIHGIRVDTVSINGAPISASDRSAIFSVATELEVLPKRQEEIPFQLEIHPVGAWVNLQCELAPADPNTVATILDDKIHNWADVVLLGGFHVLTTEINIEDLYGISLSRPTVAEDFIEWHIQMPDVPPESLNCLINMLALFSESFLPIHTVYIG